MKYKVYILNQKGWVQVYENKNIDKIKECLWDIMTLEEPIRCIVKYRQDDCDHILTSFSNHNVIKENILRKILERKEK